MTEEQYAVIRSAQIEIVDSLKATKRLMTLTLGTALIAAFLAGLAMLFVLK